MEIPKIIFQYQHILTDYRNATTIYMNELHRLFSEEKTMLNTEDDWRLVMQSNEDYASKMFDKARQIIKQTVDLAESAFAGDAGKLSIDGNPYVDFFIGLEGRNYTLRNEKVMELNIVDVWAKLETDYGNGKGEVKAYAQYANKIIRAFNLRQNDEIKIIGGNIVLEKTMYLDSIDKKFGNNRYSYSCKDEMIVLLSSLNKFFTWAGKEDYIHPTDLISNKLNESRRVVEPREKFVISDELYFITMNSKLDFRFSQSLGFLLQQFVTEFGELLLAKAA